MTRVQSSGSGNQKPISSKKVLTELCKLNSELWLVGGPVRDAVLGRACDDWDMVCRKSKKIAQAAAKALRAKFIVLDERHRIYRVILPDAYMPLRTLDFAELQGRGIEEDLSRRDFTINAMALSLTQASAARSRQERDGVRGIIDPFGGRRDLKSKTVRMVSAKAFQEDPLRLLRAFRFAAQFDLKIEPLTLKAIQKHRAGLTLVAAERVREELLRLWKQPRSSVALRLMDRARLLSVIFPEMESCRRTAVRYYGAGGVLKHSLQTVENLEWIFQRLDGGQVRGEGRTDYFSPITHLLSYLRGSVGGYPRTAWLKWAAFLHDIGKPTTAKMIKGRLRFFGHEHTGADLAVRVGQRLRCSRQEVQLLGMWVRNHMRTGNLAAASKITDRALSRFFRDLGENGVGMVLVSLADHYTYLSRSRWGKGTDPVEKISRKLVASFYQERSKILPERLVDGHDLMRTLRLKPGPEIGKLLEEIQDAQAEGKVRTKEEALVFARRRATARA